MPSPSRHGTPIIVGVDSQIHTLKRIELGRVEDEKDRREQFLQNLVDCHPSLIPMSQIEPAFTPLISVCTEFPTDAGFLDNLWMTPSGGIILGECKLVRNSQARREVIVQALDYSRSLQGLHYTDLQNAVRKARRSAEFSLWKFVSETAQTGDMLDESEFEDAVERKLRDGRFVTLVILDGVQEGLEALTSYLQLHAGTHLSVAIIELSLWRGVSGEIIVVPRVPLKTVLVERGIVTVDSEGLPRIQAERSSAPKRPETTTIPRPFTNSETEFYERLERNAPGLKKRLEPFLSALDGMGVIPEYAKTLILRWHPLPEVDASAGYIDSWGAVWLGDAYRSAVKLDNEDAGMAYLETLARAVGGTVKRYATEANPPQVQNSRGKSIRLSELLDHTDTWLNAIEELITATRPK